jgi:hypothetical protein
MLKIITAAILSLTLAVTSQASNKEELVKRQCRSIHLAYTKSVDDPSYAYIDLSVEKSSPGTYFCALGFHMGYIGLQELTDGKKVVIFSVWEPENGQVAKGVPVNLRVKLIRKGESVRTSRFGGEGTGGQSFFDYDWKIGEKVSFLVKSIRVNDTTTRYTGYFYNNKTKSWQLMTEFQTLAKGKQLGNGIYSFVEDFRRNYESSKIIHKANYTNAWASADAKTWLPMPKARFTGDSTPSENVNAGKINHGFFLQTGGSTTQSNTKLWQTMQTNAQHKNSIQVLPNELTES